MKPILQTPLAVAGDADPASAPGCCLCAFHARRRFGSVLLAAGAGAFGLAGAQQADDGGLQRDVGRESRFTRLVSAEQVEAAAAQQYAQLLGQARQSNAVVPQSHPQVVRLRSIAQRIIPFAPAWNRRAERWQWDVNLLNSGQLNAFCMPGGKIAFFAGLLVKLQLTDAEVAMIMGHEMAHALREHARERMGKSAATNLGASVLSSVLGLGNVGNTVLGLGSQLLSLRFSREDETEADVVGLDLAARAGYDPAAGVSLWRKMMGAGGGAPPEFMSTHPAGESRIREIQAKLPKVEPLYARAPKPPREFGPPRVQSER